MSICDIRRPATALQVPACAAGTRDGLDNQLFEAMKHYLDHRPEQLRIILHHEHHVSSQRSRVEASPLIKRREETIVKRPVGLRQDTGNDLNVILQHPLDRRTQQSLLG